MHESYRNVILGVFEGKVRFTFFVEFVTLISEEKFGCIDRVYFGISG